MRNFLVSSVLAAAATFLASGAFAKSPEVSLPAPAGPSCTYFWVCSEHAGIYQLKTTCQANCKGGTCSRDSSC